MIEITDEFIETQIKNFIAELKEHIPSLRDINYCHYCARYYDDDKWIILNRLTDLELEEFHIIISVYTYKYFDKHHIYNVWFGV